MARHAVSGGFPVIGFDPSADRRTEAAAFGISIASDARDVAQRADTLITSLPGESALSATVDAIIAAPRRDGQIVAELSTLSLEAKTRERTRLAAAGIEMLDCPVSGTGAQAARRDIVIYASGEAAACERVGPVFGAIARHTVHLGAFGNGTRMKFVANLLVAIHNVAAAEAVNLGLRAGLDPDDLVNVLASGAGGSKMLELRGPMMVRGEFVPPTMKLDVWQKDMDLIAQFAESLGVSTPLFSTTGPLYAAALAAGRGAEDTAAVFAVLSETAPESA
jgi:3-hydroxyisobutyrate dehydrogenase-like beta-hydroxyacid dehydrogenase